MMEYLLPEQRLERAIEVYEKAIKAPFYAKKYEKFPIPKTLNEWQAIPLLARQELYENTYPRSNGMLTCPLEGMIVCSTGGSTGTARYVLLTYKEWDVFCKIQAQAFSMLGIGPEDRVANLFVAGSLWPSFLAAHEVIKHIGAIHLPISANIDPEKIFSYCMEFDPTIIISLPTLFVFLADLAIKKKSIFPSLRMIAYAGEHMSEQAVNYVKRALGISQIKALSYTSADCGLMGYQCNECAPGVYHLPTGFQFLEIIDPDTGACLPERHRGEIIVTNLARTSMPIIRYQIGDVGEFLDQKCACGDPNPLFRLWGRAGEDFKLGGAYISLGTFEKILAEFSGILSLNYMVELEDIDNQMEIRLLIESSDMDRAYQIESELRARIEEKVPEIKKGIEINYIRKFDIKFVNLGALPRNPITGKVIHLKDKRTGN
jgi:phenylacetate-CoA ligase